MKKKIIVLKNLYEKLYCSFLKRGLKDLLKLNVDRSLVLINKNKKFLLKHLLINLFLILNIFVEAKKVRIRRKSFTVPFSIRFKRRLYLIIKWLVQAIKLNKKKDALFLKIESEILLIITKNINSKSLQIKKSNNTLLLSNRSNINYRW